MEERKDSRNSKSCSCWEDFNYAVEEEFQEQILDFCSPDARGIQKDKVASIEDHPFLRDFEDVLAEILGLPQKRDIDLSIDLVRGVSLVSKTTCRMGTLELKELQMQLEELL